MATTKAEDRAQSPIELKDLLAAIEPAVLAVQACERRVKQATETNKTVTADANRARDAAIRQADTVKQAAEAVFQQAADHATQIHAAAVAKAQAAIAEAKQRYTEACAKADPLLQALREQTDRVATVASRASERPWER